MINFLVSKLLNYKHTLVLLQLELEDGSNACNFDTRSWSSSSFLFLVALVLRVDIMALLESIREFVEVAKVSCLKRQ